MVFSGDSISKSAVDPFRLLTDSANKQLEPYRQPGPRGGKPYFAVDYADAAAGKILVTLNAVKKARQAALTIDSGTHELSPPIEFPQLTVHTVHLMPDARQVLVEGFDWREVKRPEPASGTAESQPSIFRTGYFFTFSTDSGKQIREFRAKGLSGSNSRLICMTADGKLAFYAVDGRLYALHLRAGAVAQVRTSPGFRFDQFTKFTFTGGSLPMTAPGRK